jgi:hypothetical protein
MDDEVKRIRAGRLRSITPEQLQAVIFLGLIFWNCSHADVAPVLAPARRPKTTKTEKRKEVGWQRVLSHVTHQE